MVAREALPPTSAKTNTEQVDQAGSATVMSIPKHCNNAKKQRNSSEGSSSIELRHTAW